MFIRDLRFAVRLLINSKLYILYSYTYI